MINSSPRISFSIADIPFNIPIRVLFAFAKESGFDGVEVLPGLKTFSTLKVLSSLSREYDLPILSLHFPFSVGKMVINSEKVYKTAQHFEALIVFHPDKKYNLNSVKQHAFLEQIQRQTKKYKVSVTLENLAAKSTLPIYSYFSKAQKSVTELDELVDICKSYNFGITLDTSHLQRSQPQSSEGFEEALPLIKNIHLSDFTNEKQHLALGMGELDVKEFAEYLTRSKYSGLITFELSPRLFYSRKKYLTELKTSLALLKSFLQVKE